MYACGVSSFLFLYSISLRVWKSLNVNRSQMLFSELACFTHSVDSFRLEGLKFNYDSLWLHRAKPLEVYVANLLVPQLDVCLGFERFGVHGRLYVLQIKDATLRPFSMSRPSFSMKQPSLLKWTCMPWSTIWSTETKVFVMVGTCNTFFMQFWLPSFPNETSPMCRMGCKVSSPVSM